jgi:glycosyltransferase involved in cell wall biosynthesis
VVICTYNGASRIGKALECLVNQKGTEGIAWEVIVVDNHSDDNTAAVAQSSWISETPLRIVQEVKKGITYARIAGIHSACYAFITFIDDDNLVDPDWIRAIFDCFTKNPQIDVCGGESEALTEAALPEWFGRVQGAYAVGRQADFTSDITESKGTLWGAGISFRMTCFTKIITSGFQFHTIGREGHRLSAGDDSELCLAMVAAGYRLWYVDSLKLKHAIPASRITWRYATGIFKGLGESELLLDLYRLAIQRKKFPLCRLYFPLIPYSIIYFGWRFVNLVHHQEGNPRYLSYLARKHYILKLLESWRIIPKEMKAIREYCERARK